MSLDRFRVAVNQAVSDPEKGKKGELKEMFDLLSSKRVWIKRTNTHLHKDCPKKIRCGAVCNRKFMFHSLLLFFNDIFR